jgi:hypothetical protein
MLHVVYRSFGGENAKGRPPYYSKLLCLASFVRAVETAQQAGVEVEVVYLNDGSMPGDCLALMARSGEVVQRFGLGNKGSLRAALSLPAERNWSDDDLVWLAEDDYLYLPDALASLAAAPAAFPEAEYFALYASVGHRPPCGRPQPDFAYVPPAWRDTDPVQVLGRPWRRGLSTTATFGGRVRALREDVWLFNIALFSGSGWDHTWSLLYQGFRPFDWQWLVAKIKRARSEGTLRVARQSAISALRACINVAQSLRIGALGTRSKRLLVTADPALATHLEAEFLARETDWSEIAMDCARWASELSVPIQLGPMLDADGDNSHVHDERVARVGR